MKNYVKKISVTLLLCICYHSYAQQEFWITDSLFDTTINNNDSFEDGAPDIIVVEFWTEWNSKNAFDDWKKLTGVRYYRMDFESSQETAKKYGVRRAPHIIIFKDGYVEEEYKVDLSFKLSVTVEEVQKRINELLEASKF